MNGIASAGSATTWAKGDHVHPTDTSLLPKPNSSIGYVYWDGSSVSADTITYSDVGAAPTSHASTATTYGKGTSSNYGHVKLSDSTSSTLAAASDGTAATPKAVSDALQAAKDYADNKTDANTTYTLTKSGSTITLTGSDGSTTSVTDDSGAALSPEQIDRTEESTLYVMGTNGNTGVIQYNDDAYI